MSANNQPIIYLDNNATTKVDPLVLEAMLPWLGDEYGNPSSVYSLGKRAAAAVETARQQIARLIGCAPSELIFTSCGSESINSAVLSAVSIDPDKTHVVTSAVEHSATIKLCEHLTRRGYEITWLPVDSLGALDLERLGRAIRPDTALVTLLWANNETGVLFPVEEIARITNRCKVPLHVDAVQAVESFPFQSTTWASSSSPSPATSSTARKELARSTSTGGCALRHGCGEARKIAGAAALRTFPQLPDSAKPPSWQSRISRRIPATSK